MRTTRESSLYYLQSRYYSPTIGRFISADTVDVLGSTPTSLSDVNLFAYCDNNPIARIDANGQIWDVVFDVISIGTSISEVVVNPMSTSAWIALGLDLACAVLPGVTGGGTAIRAITKANCLDEAWDIYRAADKASDIRTATGSYEIVYKSGNTYVGKGGYKRALNSAKEKAEKYSDEVASFTWKSAPNERVAMIEEYKSMCKYGGPNNRAIGNKKSYNKIWSPGRKYHLQDFGSYYEYGGRSW